MDIRKAYEYIYYKIYKFLEKTEIAGFWMEWRACCLVLLLNIFIIFSIINYYTIISKTRIIFSDSSLFIYISAFFLAFFNYKIFLSKNKWKKIIIYFDRLPQKINERGTLIVLVVIIFIICNLIFSFYLLS